MPVTQSELIDLAIEINKSAPSLTNLDLENPRVGRYLRDGVLERCIDVDTLQAISSAGVNDTLGLLGSHLAHVSESKY